MKYPFKLSKSNIIYCFIVILITIIINKRLYGFDSNSFGYIFGSVIGVILLPTLIALIFWLFFRKKENSGTITFNIILTFMLIGTFSEFKQITKDRQEPIKNIRESISEYKESALKNPESTDTNYFKLSSNVKKSIDDLIKTSIGEEKEIYLILKDYFKKLDSVNMSWNNAYNEFAEPRILDYTVLNNKEECQFQKKVIQKYIDESKNFKTFILNRVKYLKNQTKSINKNNTFYKGFTKGLTKMDSIQKPIFIPYINAHIDYGIAINKIIELLEKEKGKWEYENEMITFQNSTSQINYQSFLDIIIEKEGIVDDFFDKLLEVM